TWQTMRTRSFEMDIHNLIQHKKILAAAGVVLVGAAACAIAMLSGGNEVKLPKEFSVKALQTASEDPAQMRERFREAFQRQDLTEQQRRQLFHNVRQVMEARMDQRLDEYFTANESQRGAVLDRHLDEMRKRMQQWQREREQRRSPGDGDGRRPTAGTDRRGDDGERRMGMGFDRRGDGRNRGPDGGPRDGRRGPPSREARKERSESRNPDARARRMAYFTALRKRAEERGIEMPSFRGMGRPRGPR
ncbi:MAG: hypothetical protein JSV03_16380, partial [Planctomycetota bacterium]